jgi:arginyl-tRNA synthetase
MIKSLIETLLTAALTQAREELGGLAALDEPSWQALLATGLKVERPRQKDHGDYAVNVSFLARHARLAPPKIAETLCRFLPQNDERFHVSAIAGFINFKFSSSLLAEALLTLLHHSNVGQNESLKGLRPLLEYVSANPTGPLHIGHGRWAALGDSVRRILAHCGATVTTEFYINDQGKQMGNLAQSLWYRCLEQLGLGKLPEPVDGEPYPFYPGDYVLELAQEYLSDATRKAAVEAQFAEHGRLLDDSEMREFARARMLASQQRLLEQFRVGFDIWTSEKTLHQQGLVETVLEKLRRSGYTREEDGALWLKSSELGDEKDRVLVKSDGQYTYLAADIAYHDDKYTRQRQDGRGPAHNRFINIWGADHHGYIARMKAAIQALGHDSEQFEVLLGQLVNLLVDGEKTRMGKRRKMLTLEDVIEAVGVDATRFWLVARSADTTIDFDVDLAASHTDENPVFYVQYAHARCASILRNATEPAIHPETGEAVPPRLSSQTLSQYQTTLSAQGLVDELFGGLQQDERALAVVKDLILLLDSFEDRVSDAGQIRAPQLITRFALELASEFHSFYNVCRVLTQDPTQTQVRLMLIVAIQKTLAKALELLGVSAPDRM